MAITYEEALATLEAMFGEPWTRETLDAVLRHEKGHMENTCDRILNHGSQDPQILVDRLKAGGEEPQVAMDEQLARQLAGGDSNNNNTSGGAPASAKKGRGTPTTLPDDFLRVKTSTSQATMDSDEALARMLQDQLFSEELRRNPDFAHLAGRRPSTQQPQSQAANRASFTARGHQPMPMPNIMEKLSGMSFGSTAMYASR